MARKKQPEPVIEEVQGQYDLDEIRELAGEANTKADIADLLGIDILTMMENPEITRAYELGLADMRSRLRHWQMLSAESGNTQMLIWLGKVVLGQTETTESKITLTREDDQLTKSLEALAAEMESENQ